MRIASTGCVAPDRLADAREWDARGHERRTGNDHGNGAGAPEGIASS
jgi:hypothetical protein